MKISPTSTQPVLQGITATPRENLRTKELVTFLPPKKTSSQSAVIYMR